MRERGPASRSATGADGAVVQIYDRLCRAVSGQRSEAGGEGAVKGSALDSSHSHFILADDGTDDA
eukprot:3773476-Rhodomonas_salina.3